MLGAISAKFCTFDIAFNFAIPPNCAFPGRLEEFFYLHQRYKISITLSINSLRNFTYFRTVPNYRLGEDIQSKVLAFAFGLSAEIERNLISQRTKEALARKKSEGVILGRPSGKKTPLEKLKLYGKRNLIFELQSIGMSQRKIAKICKVDRNTLSRFLKIIESK